jgi:hypothetical protein
MILHAKPFLKREKPASADFSKVWKTISSSFPNLGKIILAMKKR